MVEPTSVAGVKNAVFLRTDDKELAAKVEQEAIEAITMAEMAKNPQIQALKAATTNGRF